jgi:hypothetical protein
LFSFSRGVYTVQVLANLHLIGTPLTATEGGALK